MSGISRWLTFGKVLPAVACIALVGAGATVAIAANDDGSSGNAAESQYGGSDGCTPGFWKNHPDLWGPDFSPADSFDEVFGITHFGDLTLLEAAALKGGGYDALARHAVAALLNGDNPNVNYGLSNTEIVELVQQAVASGDPAQVELAKDTFDALNNGGCSIDANGLPTG